MDRKKIKQRTNSQWSDFVYTSLRIQNKKKTKLKYPTYRFEVAILFVTAHLFVPTQTLNPHTWLTAHIAPITYPSAPNQDQRITTKVQSDRASCCRISGRWCTFDKSWRMQVICKHPGIRRLCWDYCRLWWWLLIFNLVVFLIGCRYYPLDDLSELKSSYWTCWIVHVANGVDFQIDFIKLVLRLIQIESSNIFNDGNKLWVRMRSSNRSRSKIQHNTSDVRGMLSEVFDDLLITIMFLLRSVFCEVFYRLWSSVSF